MVSPSFRKTLKSVRNQQIIIPVLRAALSNPDFQGFDIHVRGWKEGVRGFDGRFHPSTHASWTARQLTYYLLHGAELPPESPTLTYVAAVTQGTIWHNICQRILLEEGILRRNPGTTLDDPIEVQCEVTLEDDLHNLIGHADGRLATRDDELFEMKSMNGYKIDQFVDEFVLREKNPFGYYDQCQDYLMMAGLPKMRYFIMAMASPFPMQEFVVHADAEYQQAQREKYQEALDAYEGGYLPDPDYCSIGSKQAKNCPVADYCPIGRVS